MTSRAKKITELAAHTAPSADDLLVIVDSPSSNAITKKVTVGNLFSNVSSNVSLASAYTFTANNVTATNLKITRKEVVVSGSNTVNVQGQIWYDDNYIYVCTANGTVKRAALSTF